MKKNADYDKPSEKNSGTVYKRFGRIEYGYRLKKNGNTLEKNPSEIEIIKQAKVMREQGKSLRDIAGELQKKNLFSRSGKSFHPEQISRMINKNLKVI